MKNMNQTEQVVRLIVGIFLVVTTLLGLIVELSKSDAVTYALAIFGFVLIGTGAAGFCPIYYFTKSQKRKR
jgi:hypothetical protein